jgi:hypothetical protein
MRNALSFVEGMVWKFWSPGILSGIVLGYVDPMTKVVINIG